jgi:hypothetical protein
MIKIKSAESWCTYLQLVLQQVFLVRKLSVEAEELRLIGGQFLDHCELVCSECRAAGNPVIRTARISELPMTYADVHFVRLVRIHGCGCEVAEDKNGR